MNCKVSTTLKSSNQMFFIGQSALFPFFLTIYYLKSNVCVEKKKVLNTFRLEIYAITSFFQNQESLSIYAFFCSVSEKNINVSHCKKKR